MPPGNGVGDMPTSPISGVFGCLRRAASVYCGDGVTDGQLLTEFVSRQDEAAFESLIRRHGPMVLGVCRRILRHRQDAEDAFQATFLVLARRAASIARDERLGSWLYGVAYRTALEARRLTARRRTKERQVEDMPHPAVGPEEMWQDLRPVLDQELSRLPERYRLPVVLCDLEGRSRREVARQLALPEGTLSNRLAAARQMLAGRLRRRGVALDGMAVAAILSQSTALARVPGSLVVATVRAAPLVVGSVPAVAASTEVSALTEGMLRTMQRTKLNILAVTLLATVVVVGIGGLSYLPRAVARHNPVKQPARPLPTVRQVADKLGERQKRFRSLYVEYATTVKAHVDPRRLMSWNMLLDRDYRAEVKVGFAGDQRYFGQDISAGQFFHTLDEIEVDPSVPSELQERMKSTREGAGARRKAEAERAKKGEDKASEEAWVPPPGDGWRTHPGMYMVEVYDGEVVWSQRRRKDAPFGRSLPGTPVCLTSSYLDGLGLRPPWPLADEDTSKVEELARLPDSLKHYPKLSVLPRTEELDGAACVVLRAERTVEDDTYRSLYYGKERVEVETLWLDPKLGYTPRKRETTANGILMDRWEHSSFEEVAPGCWLPRKVRRTEGTPAWAPRELRNKSALTYTMKVTKWQVNDIKDDLFRVDNK